MSTLARSTRRVGYPSFRGKKNFASHEACWFSFRPDGLSSEDYGNEGQSFVYCSNQFGIYSQRIRVLAFLYYFVNPITC